MFFDDAKKHTGGIIAMSLGKGRTEEPAAPDEMPAHHVAAREALDAIKSDDHAGFAEAMRTMFSAMDMDDDDHGNEQQDMQY